MMYTDNFNQKKLRRASHKLYEYPQPEGPLAVKEYLLGNIDGKRCCLLRFVKKLDVYVTRMKLELIEYNAAGEQIAKTPHTLISSNVPQVGAGETFAPDCAMPVDASCTNIKVKIVEVVSGAYVYTVRNNKMCVDYRIRGSWKRGTYTKKEARSDEDFTVHSKLGKKVRILRFLAIATLVLLCITILEWYLVRVIPVEEIKRAIAEALKNAAEGIKTFIFSIDDYIADFFKLVGDFISGVIGSFSKD